MYKVECLFCPISQHSEVHYNCVSQTGVQIKKLKLAIKWILFPKKSFLNDTVQLNLWI